MSDTFTATATETPQQNAMIVDALELAAQATEKAQSSGLAVKVKEALINNAADIQNLINKITKLDEESSKSLFNELDEQMRLTKMRLLEEKSRSTAVKYTVYIVGAFLAVAGLLYFTKPKAKPATTPAV